MNGNRHFLRFFNSNSHSHSCNFFFGIAIPIPILILELGFHESTTELGQLLISESLYIVKCQIPDTPLIPDIFNLIFLKQL